MASKFTDYLELPLPYQKTMKLTKLAVMQKYKLNQIDEANGTIFFQAGISFSSFVENMRIKVSPNQNNTSCLVYFESECKIPTTLVDYGKNKRNITNLKSALKQLSEIP